MIHDKVLLQKITEMLENVWNPHINIEYANVLNNLIENTFTTHWKERQNELPDDIKNRLELIDEYIKTDQVLEYLRNYDKEELMKKYGWREHEAKYNKKLIFQRLENKKEELALLLGDILQ